MSKRTGLLIKTFVAAVGFQLFAAGAASAFSDSFETPPEQDPKTVLADRAAGPGFKVGTPVRSDGSHRIYELQTGAGIERIVGDGLIRFRIREFTVLSALRSLEKEESFIEGLKKAAKRPAKFVENTVTDPLGTAQSTASGVGKFIGRLSKGVEKAVTGETLSPSELAGIVSGADRARRVLALKVGVDPYTQDEALSEQLDRAAAASTSDDLSVNAVLAMVPGGISVTAEGMAEPLRMLILDSTRSEIEKYPADVLRGLRVSEPVIEAFAANPNFSPFERAVLAYDLEALTLVEGREALAARAAEAKTRDEAYLMLRQVALYEHYHRTIGPLAQVRYIADFPVAIRKDKIATLVLPLDMLSWTRTTATAISALHEGLLRLPFQPEGMDFRITGDMTDDTAIRLASFGWDVTADWPMPESPVY